MCLGPEMIIPALFSGASFIMNKKAQGKERDARDSAAAYSRTRNKIQQEQADATAVAASNQYAPGSIEDLLAKAQAEREGATDIDIAPGLDQDYAGSAPDAFKKDIGRKVVESVAEGKEQSKRTAKLNSISDALFTNSLGTADAARSISTNLGNISGNRAVSAYEMELAPRAGEGKRTVADLFGFAGDMSNIYMATGVPSKSIFSAPWTPRPGVKVPQLDWTPVR